MTDILTTDKSIAAGSYVAEPSKRANRVLVVAIAVTVAVAAAFVAINIATDGGEAATVDRVSEASQLRWEGLATNATNTPAAQTASQLRWEGLATNAINTPAAQTASQLRWEGLAGISATERSLEAQTARWEAQAAALGMR